MRIEAVEVYQVDLPLHEGSYQWSGGKSVEIFDSTVVAVRTDLEEYSGYGEVCPLGPAYLPSYASGVRAGIRQLGPALLGEDPTALATINHLMDREMKGHPYVKSALDMACWDLFGKQAGLPVYQLLGGSFGDDFVLYRAISQEDPETMAERVAEYRAQGYRRFQLKVGGDPDTDVERIRRVSERLEAGDLLIADANTGWLSHEAIRVVRRLGDVDVYIEQPCLSYRECLSVRRRTSHPFVLDESIDGLQTLMRAIRDDATDAVNIKISKLGGITRARQARDLCLSSGVAVTLEDSWGGDIVTAAIAHLAQSTPPKLLLTATDFNSYVTRSIATGAPQRQEGRLRASARPGLGIEPRLDVLGEPACIIS